MVGQQNGNGAVGGAAGLTEEEAGTLSQSQTETNAWGELVSLNACHESCQIVQNTMFMGRKDACKLKFDDPRISSLHARIERVLDGPADSGVAVVHDLSSNGTFVNGEKVGKGNSTHIKDDDMISLVVVPAKGPDGTYTHSDESMKKVFVAYTFRFLAPTQPPASITASQPSLISAATTALASGAVDARVDAEQKELNELVKTLTAKNNKTQFEKDFEQSTMLGEGGFAKVYIGVHRESKKKVAVKVIDVEKWKLNRGTLRASQIEDEISIHQQLSHPNVVRLLWCYTARRYIHIVLEKVDGGDLFDYLVNNCTSGSGLEGELCRRWFNDLLRAVDYMHSNGVVHRDLKPENILLDREDETATLKISDFGLAKVNAGSAACQTRCGTINYMAPEVAAVGGAGGSEIYGKEADMWGLGVILHVMVSLTMPFEGEESETEQKLIEMAKSGKGNLKLLQGECWRGQPTELKALLKHLLTPDTKRRATMADALASPWVQGTEGAGKRKDAGDEERGGGGTRKRGRKG